MFFSFDNAYPITTVNCTSERVLLMKTSDHDNNYVIMELAFDLKLHGHKSCNLHVLKAVII